MRLPCSENRNKNRPWDGFDTDMWDLFEIKKPKPSQQILAAFWPLTFTSTSIPPLFRLAVHRRSNLRWCSSISTAILCTSPSWAPFLFLLLMFFLFGGSLLLPLFSALHLIIFPCVGRGCKTPTSDLNSPNSQLLPLRVETGMHFRLGPSFIRNKPSTHMQGF